MYHVHTLAGSFWIPDLYLLPV